MIEPEDYETIQSMIAAAIEAHNHQGYDSHTIGVKSITEFGNAPIDITDKPPFNSPSTGGSTPLQASDSQIIAKHSLTITEMYNALKAEGLMK